MSEALPHCEQLLKMENILTAFENKLQNISSNIISCFYSCFRKLFINWARITYSGYAEDFITNLSDTSFTDGVLKFKERAEAGNLYKATASSKTIIFNFFKITLLENLQKEKRQFEKNKKIASFLEKSIATDGREELETREKLFTSLERAMNELGGKDRQIVVWRHIDGKSNDEIATLLGITVASATNRIFRCMERLRLLVEKNSV